MMRALTDWPTWHAFLHVLCKVYSSQVLVEHEHNGSTAIITVDSRSSSHTTALVNLTHIEYFFRPRDALSLSQQRKTPHTRSQIHMDRLYNLESNWIESNRSAHWIGTILLSQRYVFSCSLLVRPQLCISSASTHAVVEYRISLFFLSSWHLFQYRSLLVLFPGRRFVCRVLSLCLKQWVLIN